MFEVQRLGLDSHPAPSNAPTGLSSYRVTLLRGDLQEHAVVAVGKDMAEAATLAVRGVRNAVVIRIELSGQVVPA